MERALDPSLLTTALGEPSLLPTPAQLAATLGAAEIALLAGQPEAVDELMATGWYLFGVASSLSAVDKYGVDRQRAAFRVSSHIFDLGLQYKVAVSLDKLELCFAAQMASLRSGLTPNASAIYKRESSNALIELTLHAGFSEAALAVTVAFLGMDIGRVLRMTTSMREEQRALAAEWGVIGLNETPFAAAVDLSMACRDLAVFVLYGDRGRIAAARRSLTRAATSASASSDRSSRWAAAHLIQYLEDFDNSSIWTALPQDTPSLVKRAFVLTKPCVAQLWPSQVGILKATSAGDNGPLDRRTRRQVISTPTSAGKTLFAQILIASHLATSQDGVCYVAPTRSLCHEVSGELEKRLRYLRAKLRADLPPIEALTLQDFLSGFNQAAGEVEVMTPERLAYLLRTDAAAVLNRFGLFVFDEAHTVAESSRGWTLESSIAYLHHATLHTAHRIVLVSAALGNRVQFASWLTTDETKNDVILSHGDWRGPRRLHCLWTTQPQWEQAEVTPGSGAMFSRRRTPLAGVLSVRPTPTALTTHLRLNTPVGTLVQRLTALGVWQKDNESTPSYQTLGPLINHLLLSGPVLVIEATKRDAVKLAKTLATALSVQVSPALIALRDLVVARLGADHPLAFVIARGVGYHHGALPAEVRTAIEEAVADGHVRCVVATPTLADGINLPVRSVVIAAQGVHTAEGMHEFITGAKLVNAIGRAGRAAKETEGVVVLARPQRFDPQDFGRLAPDDTVLSVRSALATEQALAELAQFEELVAASVDALFEVAGELVPRFVSFLWFVASALEIAEQEVLPGAVASVLESTLAWQQIEQSLKVRWRGLANVVVDKFLQTDPTKRRRWASSGARLSTARLLDELAEEVLLATEYVPPLTSPADALAVVFSAGRLEQLLGMAEAPIVRLYNRRAAPRVPIEVQWRPFLNDWIAGTELDVMGARHLWEITDIEYRSECLGEILNAYPETYLPYAVGNLTTWVNRMAQEVDRPPPLPNDLPAYLKYGVGSGAALRLAMGGIRSRALCTRIALVADAEGRERDSLKEWLGRMSIADWQSRFAATTGDLRNLVAYARPDVSSIAGALLAGDTATIPIIAVVPKQARETATIVPVTDGLVPEANVLCLGRRVGVVPASAWQDVSVLVESGLALEAEAEVESGVGTLWLTPLKTFGE